MPVILLVVLSTTTVEMMALSAAQIEYYIATGEHADKAGSYGVQEWIGYIGIESVKGSYYNVMGLPTHRLFQALKRIVSSENELIMNYFV